MKSFTILLALLLSNAVQAWVQPMPTQRLRVPSQLSQQQHLASRTMEDTPVMRLRELREQALKRAPAQQQQLKRPRTKSYVGTTRSGQGREPIGMGTRFLSILLTLLALVKLTQALAL